MNIFKHNAAKLNDIVFENRNKSYGAYAIRSSYDVTLLKSLLITTFLFAGLAIAAAIYTHSLPKDELKLDAGTNLWNDSLITIPYTYIEPSKVETPANHPPVSSSAQTPDVAPIITDNPSDQNNHVIENPDIDNPNPNGIDNGIDNGSATTNTGISEDPGINVIPTSEPVLIADVMPKFDNMPRFLRDNLRYPEMARNVGITGKVVVNYIVDENGEVQNPIIIKHLGGGCDEEVLRVIKLMHKWTPGMVHGKAVKVRFNQVIDFKLQ